MRSWLPPLVGLLATVLALVLLAAGVSLAASPACPVPLVERQRYGFVATAPSWPDTFDYGSLKAGWVVDFAYHTYSTTPVGIDRGLVIRVHDGYTVDRAQLGPLVDDNPGVIWLVGNEPDCIWQDNVVPEEYARIYHDLYTFIKNRDLSSQVAPGGIVQPTPLRLEYLDRVLAAYQAQYGQPMPADVWNIHNAILNEARGDWGAEIPPGIEADVGVLRSVDDNDNMAIFEDQIWAFRQWMADNGYGSHPLIVTEYGVLMGEYWYPQFNTARVNAFMSNTFDFFQTATDPALGDPNDGYRLVQRWAWFSLDVPRFHPITAPDGFNGNLFDPETTAITAHGERYASHTTSFPPLDYVDLGFAAWYVPPATGIISPTQTMTRPVHTKIANLGHSDSGSFTVTLAYDGPVSDTLKQGVSNLPPLSSEWLAFTLTDLKAGGYEVSVWIDAEDQVAESRECNNEATTTVIAPTARLHLPLVLERSASALGHGSAAQAGTGPAGKAKIGPRDIVTGFQEFEVPTANAYPAQIALDAQGRVWISERDGNKIARFDPQTEDWQEYEIPTAGSQPWGLALDGEGGAWFAETAANQIGRLEMASGLITETAVPTANSEPWGITFNDGIVWFTEKAGDKVGKLVAATGAITEYTLPTPGARPGSIASHGSFVWFTETAANKLGWLNATTGSILGFTPPTPDSVPQDVVVSTGGLPWLTEMAGNNVALFRATTIQDFTEIPVATANSEPYGITLEENVAVWFTERAGNKIGRYSGALPPSEYRLPTPGSMPTDITVDGDGCAWYTAPGANRIGRLCLPLTHFTSYLPLIIKD